MKYSSDHIEGLDEPMINPELIPEGYVQDYDKATHMWRVRRMGKKFYLPHFPVINFEEDGHPDMIV